MKLVRPWVALTPGLGTIMVQIPLLLLTLARDLGASSCSDEEVFNCKTAVRSGNLSKLQGGGDCQVKHYVHFTHLCTVENYVPSIDYCCCAHEQKTLCCRYHYDWNYFRCTAAEDTIDNMSNESLPQELLLTAILVPTAAALCCVICCVRCLCCRDDEDDTPCGCSKCKEKDTTAEKFTVGRSKRYHDVKRAKSSSVFYDTSDTKLPLSTHDDSTKARPSSSFLNGAVPTVPSAPPLEDPALAHLLSSSQPQPTTLANFSSGNLRQSNSTSSGYYLHYVPLQHSSTTKPTDPTYQEIRPAVTSPALPNTAVPNTYQVDTGANCCHGNPTPTQTLIGILTKQEVVGEVPPAVPNEPPPAYEDSASFRSRPV